MEIVPFSNDLFKQRSNLLQQSLRPNCNSYPIESEYPIVLSKDNPQFSYCVTESDRKFSPPKLVAHANFWPRMMFEKSTQVEYPIALVGNVATDLKYRGCGVMKNLLESLWRRATQSSFHALILWSDLHQFYQKLGFTACGYEHRICFSHQKLQNFTGDFKFVVPASESFGEDVVNEMLRLRVSTPFSLKRSSKEFMELLKIPDTIVLMSYQDQELNAYVILGKGNDMIGVVHEWGASKPEIILAALKHIVLATRWQHIWLLAPVNIGNIWMKAFQPYTHCLETHPLALAKCKEGSPIRKVIENGFIWGLDSI